MPGTPKIKLGSSKRLPGIIIIIIIIILLSFITIIIFVIIIITYVWIKSTREQVPQSNLSNNEGRSKKL